MKFEDIRKALLEIEACIKSSEFNAWRIKFVENNVDSFTFEDENKLIYTQIHQEYESQIEKRISEYLPDNFDMGDFMNSLPDYIEGPGARDNETAKAITMLLEVSDYSQFKEMMLFRKREKDESNKKRSDEQLDGIQEKGSSVLKLDVHGMMDKCASLTNAAENEAGWENLLTLDWMKIDKKPYGNSNNEIFLRGVWTMNLSVIECCDMMFTFGPRRQQWDSNIVNVTFPYGGSDQDDDMICSAQLNFGYLVNLIMFGTQEPKLNTRNYRRWNYPRQGEVTYAMVPWDIKNNKIDAENKLLSLKTGTIAPHPHMTDKCIMTTLEISGLGGVPTWAMYFMTRATAPQLMRGLESRYIANIRDKNTVKNVTPFHSSSYNDGESKHEEKKSHK